MMKVGALLATELAIFSSFLLSGVRSDCWAQCYWDTAPGWLCRRQACDECGADTPQICSVFCETCPYSVYSGAPCQCDPPEWEGDCFGDQIGWNHELTARLNWHSRTDPFGFRERRTYLMNRQQYDPLSDTDDTMIAGALYTLSEGTLKLTVMLPPLYPAESRVARVILSDSSGNTVDAKNCNIKTHTWHCLYRLDGISMNASHSYRIEYRPNTSNNNLVYSLEGSIPQQQGFPKIAAIGCFGQDDKTDKTKLVAAVRAQDPDLIVLQGDQTYFHQDTLYGFFETIYSMRDLLKDVPVIVQMDDHDYGSGNLWGGENLDHNSGVGFVKPPCLVNHHQDLAMGHLPDPATTATLDNGITIHYTNYVYGIADLAVLEARKFKNYNPDGTILGPQQEAWLRGFCNDNSRVKVVLSQTPFSNLATDYTWEKPEIQSNEGPSSRDSNGAPRPGRDAVMGILENCGPTPVTLLSGDIHMAASVLYHDYGVLECTSPAAVNDIFWRMSFFDKNANSEDVFGNKLRLLDVYNVAQSVRDQSGIPDNSVGASDGMKHERGDGFLMFRHDENSRTCSAHGYRTGRRYQQKGTIRTAHRQLHHRHHPRHHRRRGIVGRHVIVGIGIGYVEKAAVVKDAKIPRARATYSAAVVRDEVTIGMVVLIVTVEHPLRHPLHHRLMMFVGEIAYETRGTHGFARRNKAVQVAQTQLTPATSSAVDAQAETTICTADLTATVSGF